MLHARLLRPLWETPMPLMLKGLMLRIVGIITLVLVALIFFMWARMHYTTARVQNDPSTEPDLAAAKTNAEPLLQALEKYRGDNGIYPATLDQLTGGRTAIHIISGGNDAEQRQDGDYLSHDERYVRTEEYLDVLRAIWTSREPIDHAGHYYRFDRAFAEVKSVQQPHIPVKARSNR